MKPGELGAADPLELVEHPEHVLAVGHDVGGRNVLDGADVRGDLADPAAADAFLFAVAEVVRVADDPALAAAERDVDNGALPGHPHGQGADGVHGFVRMEADAALAGAAGVVVLNAEALEHLGAAVVHADGDLEMILAQSVPEQVPGGGVEAELLGHGVELLLGHFERVERLLLHQKIPPEILE